MFKSLRSIASAVVAWLTGPTFTQQQQQHEPPIVYVGDPAYSFKPFFIHRQRIKPFSGKHNGFTAYISPNAEDARMCDVQVTYCSRKDQFCKKEGRSFALKAPIKTVNKRDLPTELNRIHIQLHNWKHSPSDFDNSWHWVLKYVI
jgi:hypothetical protein